MSPRLLARRQRLGMTLIEMLIAVTLTIMLMSFFTTLIASANRGVTTARGIAEIDQRVRAAVTLIKDDLDAIYIQDANGEDMTPSELFTQYDKIPSGGYFLLEENSPAAFYPAAAGVAWTAGVFPTLGNRQGLDQFGIPIEIDTDDVIAFTARNAGVSPESFFWGRVPALGAAVVAGTVPAIYDIDNGVSAGASLDLLQRNNGLIASRFAEIVYFLRPSNRQYAQADLNNPPNGTVAGAANPPAPATFNLYRRQLVVLPESTVENLEQKGFLIANSINFAMALAPVPPSTSYYQHYDVSSRWDPSFANPANARMRFNTLATLAQRRNRFGMIPQDALWLRELPFTNAGPPSAGAQTDNINYPARGIHTPNDAWYGRPIQKETSHPAYPYNPTTNLNAALPAAPFTPLVFIDANGNGVVDAYDGNATTRQGEDILLTNVVSFDIKVLDDDLPLGVFGANYSPSNPRDWPAYRTARNATASPNNWTAQTAAAAVPTPYAATPATNPAIDSPTLALNPLMDPVGATSQPFRRQEFVDLGYRASSATPPTREQFIYDLDQSQFNLPLTGYVGALPPQPPLPATLPPPIVVRRDVIGKHLAARWRTAGRAPVGPCNPAAVVLTNQAFAAGATAAQQRNPVSTYDSWWAKNADGTINSWNTSEGPVTQDFRPPPYDRPLRSIQIRLRIYESKSGLVRDFTITHSFAKS